MYYRPFLEVLVRRAVEVDMHISTIPENVERSGIRLSRLVKRTGKFLQNNRGQLDGYRRLIGDSLKWLYGTYPRGEVQMVGSFPDTVSGYPDSIKRLDVVRNTAIGYYAIAALMEYEIEETITGERVHFRERIEQGDLPGEILNVRLADDAFFKWFGKCLEREVA